MIEILMTKAVDLTFKLNIEGTQSLPKVRLVIEKPDINIMFPGTVSGDSTKVVIPELRKFGSVFSEGRYQAYLEVLIEDNRFVPWEDVINLSYPVAVKAAMEDISQNEEDTSTNEPVITVVENTSPSVSYSDSIVETDVQRDPPKNNEVKVELRQPQPLSPPISEQDDEEDDDEEDDEVEEKKVLYDADDDDEYEEKTFIIKEEDDESEDYEEDDEIEERKTITKSKKRELSIDEFLNFEGNAKDFLND